MRTRVAHSLKRALIVLAALVLWPAPAMPDNPGEGEVDYGMFDRTITLDGYSLRVRRIPQPDFTQLHAVYFPGDTLSYIEGTENIESHLPGYRFVHSSDIPSPYNILDTETKQLLHNADFGDIRYYPSLGVLTYFVGHGGVYGVDLATGEAIDYDPAVTSWSADGRYRYTGMYDGWDNSFYRFDRFDPATGRWEMIVTMSGILASLPDGILGTSWDEALRDRFWVGNKFYFRCEGRCTCIIIE